MTYEKQTWTTGEVITADKLNHMEDGIGGAFQQYEITYSNSVYELDGISRAELKTLIETSQYAPIYFYHRQDGNACYASVGGYGTMRGTMGQVTGIYVTLLGPAIVNNSSGPDTASIAVATIPFDESQAITFTIKKTYLNA